ncbi:hypothetical protein PV08_09924 [Exophiala spinifera]|uniref:C3H1-type domain-containing protein n=1 Tax=Exophiala spinifera TaxID=91928 RepID=A0A0D1YCJ4_9EURO|nr:uncharacterized protein PV08_09924 [Exophiala spinifera]KIW12646.1 hypothetical protein PV08_09924 [Exophiala spinifera]
MEESNLEAPMEAKAIAKRYQDYRQRTTEQDAFVDELVKALTLKEQEYHELKADLQDQTESRRRWQKRALDTSVQHLLVLIDGNQHFFKPHFIRSGAAGAHEAVERFVAEVKDFARAQHKNDLPEGVSLVTHIFSDIGQLAHDLSAANLIPEPDRLWPFILEVCRVEPGITITDCGSGPDAVRHKLKYHYELFLENCHCRHVFLALGQQSEYYKVLEQYGDDDYTLGKTTLVRPAHGFAESHNLPFHTIELSMFDAVPNNNKNNTTLGVLPNGSNPAPPAQWNDPLPAKPSDPVAVASTDWQPTSRGDEALLLSSNIASPQVPPEPKVVPKGPANGTLANGVNGSPGELDNESLLGVVKLDSSHSSSQTRKAAQQSWETSMTENSYIPAPIQEPWGEETNGTNGYEEEDYSKMADIPQTRAHARRGARGSAKRNSQSTLSQDRRYPSTFPRTQVHTPKQFEGSWDDMLRQQETRSPVGPVSQAASDPQRPASSASSVAASAFTKKILSTPEPHPERRPICAPVALNKFEQRIDLKLPKPSLEDQELCDIRTRNRKLCNEHHLRSNCKDPNCKYDHESIVDGVYLALRIKARKIACSVGPGCRRHDCYASHHCPNVSHSSTCGRPNCYFASRGMHAVTDLEIARMIEPNFPDGS